MVEMEEANPRPEIFLKIIFQAEPISFLRQENEKSAKLLLPEPLLK